MKRLRTIAVVGALLAIVGAPLAYAAGLWFGLPVVGGGTYCSGQVTTAPGAATPCATTVPSGPTGLTGNELIPSDLNPNGAQNTYPLPGTGASAPQTGYVPVANGASGAYQLITVLTPATTATFTVNNGITNVVMNATGTQTYTGLLLPVTPTDGQIVRFTSNATITTLIVTSGIGSTATVDTPTKVISPFDPLPPALLTTSATIGGVSYLYNLSNNRWFRLQ